MASRQRKLQKDATLDHHSSDERAAISEFALHLALRITTANRLKLTKVRLDMIDMNVALYLTDLLTKEINSWQS